MLSIFHGEVKHDPATGDICLVEVGARTHGGSGDWISIADEAVGLNQVVANVDASVSAEAFDALPNKPPAALHASGRIWLALTQGVAGAASPREAMIRSKSGPELEVIDSE